jgi:probable H4MPT-linked C1 transfer pathway protein
MKWLALDIGGANLKGADGRRWTASGYFPLWRQYADLPAAIAELLSAAPDGCRADGIAVTMTGELADCFVTKRQGVDSIVGAVEQASAGRTVRIYTTDGTWVAPDEARQQPLRVAAANWHALARFAVRWVQGESGLLVDIGSTTSDIVPLCDGAPAPAARTDTDRLACGELVYTGVQRSPVCAVVPSLPWRDMQVPVAQELFATTWDAYLMLGDLPEEPQATHTADGRPATRAHARQRLARCICADAESFTDADALHAAEAVARAQLSRLGIAAQGVLRRMARRPSVVVVSGQGEFLARRLVERLRIDAQVCALSQRLGPEASRCATAHALAVLAHEELAC